VTAPLLAKVESWLAFVKDGRDLSRDEIIWLLILLEELAAGATTDPALDEALDLATQAATDAFADGGWENDDDGYPIAAPQSDTRTEGEA